MNNSFGEYKLLFVVVFFVTIIMTMNYASAQTTYGQNNTGYNYNAESYKQIQNQIKTLLMEKQMQANSTKWMSASQQKNRDFITSFLNKNPYPTVELSSSLQIEKRNIAFGQSGYLFEDYMTNYDHGVKDQTRALLAEYKDYNSEKIVPSYTSCIAFHDCKNPQFIPTINDQEMYMVKTNATTMNPIQGKPEYVNNTGFVSSNPTWIHNMQDLQAYMTNKSK